MTDGGLDGEAMRELLGAVVGSDWNRGKMNEGWITKLALTFGVMRTRFGGWCQ